MAVSMTGYGSGKANADGREVAIELRAVNHRYLDPAFRLPKALAFAEDALRKQMQQTLSRGHVDVFVTYKNTREDARQIVCDTALAKSYVDAAQKLADCFGVKNDLTAVTLLRLPDVTREEEAEEDRDALEALCHDAMVQALEELCAMRRTEGERLAADLCARCDTVRGIVDEITARVPKIQIEARQRLTQRMTEILENVRFDPERLEQEVVLIVERGSITEELVRLASHMTQMKQILAVTDQSVGRKLDFLVQEMNREINTIGSKSADLAVANMVVQAKSEIEKIREQVQNIE